MLEEATYLGARQARIDLVCMLCVRTVASARGPRDHPLTLASLRGAPEHAESIRRLCCPYCRGRLWLEEIDDVYVAAPVPPDDLRPRRARPKKSREDAAPSPE